MDSTRMMGFLDAATTQDPASARIAAMCEASMTEERA